MTRLPAATAAALASAAFAGAMFATPAAAQDDGGDRVNQVIIFGDDECPQSTGDTITVCARLDESERYRIPSQLRQSGSPQNESWTQRVQSLEAVGDFGPLSCTPVGAGADLGCTMEMIETAYAERANSSSVRFGELIAAARDERLSTIDADTAEYQQRVEALEQEEFARRRAAQGELLPGEETAPGEAELVDPAAIPNTPPPPPGG